MINLAKDPKVRDPKGLSYKRSSCQTKVSCKPGHESGGETFRDSRPRLRESCKRNANAFSPNN